MLSRRTKNHATSRPTIYVHLSRGLDADQYRARYLAGLEPDETPYGFHLARLHNFEVIFSTDSSSRLSSMLSRACQKLLGFDVAHAYRNRAKIRQSDIIWTMTEPESFAIAVLIQLRIVQKLPLVANVVWLFNRWQTISRSKQITYQLLAHKISISQFIQKSVYWRPDMLFQTLRVNFYILE